MPTLLRLSPRRSRFNGASTALRRGVSSINTAHISGAVSTNDYFPAQFPFSVARWGAADGGKHSGGTAERWRPVRIRCERQRQHSAGELGNQGYERLVHRRGRADCHSEAGTRWKYVDLPEDQSRSDNFAEWPPAHAQHEYRERRNGLSDWRCSG